MSDFNVHDPRFDGPRPANVSSSVETPKNLPTGDLPPVEPPSAGFIMQLFVVPALIVMAVVGVWTLFGRIAGGEQDWKSLVSELRNGNEHRRWRAALGLAQMLKGDQERGDQGAGLARDPQVCQELSGLLKEELKKTSPREDDLKQQAFLARTLGFLDRPADVLPTLTHAIEPVHDLDVRRNAVASIALVLGRAQERGEQPASDELVDKLVAGTMDTELQIRQLSVYSLGLIPDERSRQQLELLAQSSSEDPTVRGNAAVGLARQHSKAGLGYFRMILEHAGQQKEQAVPQYVDFVSVRNTILSLKTLKPELTAEEREEFVRLLAPLAEHYPDSRLQLDAKSAQTELRG